MEQRLPWAWVAERIRHRQYTAAICGRGNPAARAVRLKFCEEAQRVKLGQRKPGQPHTTKLLMYGDTGPNRFAVYLWIAYQHGRAHAVVCCCQ
jgi:hypothetical protein